MSTNYLNNYFNKFSKLLVDFSHKDFLKIINLIKKIKKKKKKLF